MPQTVLVDKKGLTLIEVMVALIVLLLVFLALMQTALLSIDSNMINVLRDEAVNIAESQMSVARNRPFDNILSVPAAPVLRNIRNISNFSYSAVTIVTNLNADNKQIVITVTWDWKTRTAANGNPYTHTISAIVRRP